MIAENKIEKNINSPEQIPAGLSLEKNKEIQSENRETVRKVEIKDQVESKAAATAVPAVGVQTGGDYYARRGAAIDSILSDGLDGIYIKMSPAEQNRFKTEGERTAGAINQLLNKAKTGAGKIISLIKKWLGLIPGVSRFFLEQEAKIKADKILNIKKTL